MALALHQLVGRPGRGDGLADTQYRPLRPQVRLCELVPGVDDVGQDSADLVHIGERDVAGRGAERPSQAPDLPVADSDHDGLAGTQPVPQERIQPGDELVLARIQERLVPERHPPSSIARWYPAPTIATPASSDLAQVR